jgi:metal-responsive CopG/Arc/MetJ family transcriptional regulator
MQYNEISCNRRVNSMNSQLTVRLPDNLEKELSLIARKLQLKRSDIVRMALERFVKQAEGEEENSPYEKVKSLLGSVSSGISDLGESHREHLLRKMKRHA